MPKIQFEKQTYYNLINKTDWPQRGPWDTEPDEASFVYKNYRCVMSRSSVGWRGYVAVETDHPWFGKSKDDLLDISLDRGITYAGFITFSAVHYPEMFFNLWGGVGFHCSYSRGLLPSVLINQQLTRYTDIHDVKHYTCQLADWVKRAAVNGISK